MTTLIRNVRIFTPGSAPSGPLDVTIDGTKISAIGRDAIAGPATEIIDGSGHLLMPGLINGHFHSPVNHMKGALPSLPLEIFMLYESPALDELLPTPREAYVRTLLAALEMLKLGVTAVQDDAFFVPNPTPEIIDAVLQAYADCGIRARVALDQPNIPELDKLPFLAELLPPDLRQRLAMPPAFGMAPLLAAYRHLIDRWHGYDNGRLKAAVSCSAPQRVTVPYFEALDDLSRQYDLPFYAHMLETKLQRVFGAAHFDGRSLVRYVDDLGLISDRMNIIHAIWVDDYDLDLIAKGGATIAHNPISNLRLGSGVMPFRRIRDRGIPICLGSDEAIADDTVNMWSVAKLAGLIHNIGDPDYETWPSAGEVLDCLFTGGAHALREDTRLGVIDVGREADLVLVDLDTLAFTPLNDLERQLVYCENGSSVRLTMVAGQVVFADGRIQRVDEPAIRAEAREIHARQSSALKSAEATAAEWLPYYKAMYRQATRTDVGMNRWVGDAGAVR